MAASEALQAVLGRLRLLARRRWRAAGLRRPRRRSRAGRAAAGGRPSTAPDPPPPSEPPVAAPVPRRRDRRPWSSTRAAPEADEPSTPRRGGAQRSASAGADGARRRPWCIDRQEPRRARRWRQAHHRRSGSRRAAARRRRSTAAAERRGSYWRERVRAARAALARRRRRDRASSRGGRRAAHALLRRGRSLRARRPDQAGLGPGARAPGRRPSARSRPRAGGARRRCSRRGARPAPCRAGCARGWSSSPTPPRAAAKPAEHEPGEPVVIDERRAIGERPADDRRPPRRFFIETWGCQMNELDSQRLAGQLMQQGILPTRDAGGGRRHPAQLLQRAREGGAEGLLAARRVPAAQARARRSCVLGLCGCVAQQEGERALRARAGARLRAGPGAGGRAARGAARGGARGERVVATGFPERARLRPRRGRARRLAQGHGDDHRGLQQELHLLHRADDARARALPAAGRDVAEVRAPRRLRLRRDRAARPDRQPLARAGRRARTSPTCCDAVADAARACAACAS